VRLFIFTALLSMLFPFALAQPGSPYVPCLDTMAINSRSVFVGTIVSTHELDRTGANTNAVVLVEQRLKGDIPDKTQALILVPPSILANWKARNTRLLIFNGVTGDGNGVIDLSSRDLKVLTAEMKLLTRPEEVLEAAQRAIARHPGVTGLPTFWRTVPQDVVRMLDGERFLTTTLPANADSERWAIGALTSSQVRDRAEAAHALGYFPSEANIERLKRLLDDPGVEESGDPGTQIYTVRARAFQMLMLMGVNVEEPVLRKQIR
jgi:hypothetical protein